MVPFKIYSQRLIVRPALGVAVAAAALVLSVNGCDSSVTQQQMDDSRYLELARSIGLGVQISDTALIVVATPAECFVCSDLMQSIARQSRGARPRSYIVFLDEPTRDESIQLALQRIRPAKVLARSDSKDLRSGILLVAGDSVVAIAPLVSASLEPAFAKFLQLSDASALSPVVSGQGAGDAHSLTVSDSTSNQE